LTVFSTSKELISVFSFVFIFVKEQKPQDESPYFDFA